MDEIGTGDEHVGGFDFAAVHVEGCLEGGATGDIFVGQAENIDHIIALAGELRLREEREQRVVAAVAVHDDDLFAAVAVHLADRLVQEGELRGKAVGDGAGLLASFEDLTEIVLGEDDGVFLLDGIHHREADIGGRCREADAGRAFR